MIVALTYYNYLKTSSYYDHEKLIVFRVLNELYVCFQMNAISSCGRGIRHMADFKPSLSFPFRSPEVTGCWLLLRVTAPCGVCWYWPNHHRAPLEHGASLEGVSGRNCFFTLWHGFANWKRKK